MSGEHDLEREIAAVFAEAAPSTSPDYLLPSVISSARRKRRWPRWYALVKEPTMHNESRLLVGSPTARVAIVMVATLLVAAMVAGAGIAGARLLAAGPIVVDQSGDGTVTTITEAVAMAEDGDIILVKPGMYVEAIVIEKDITLSGDGDRERIVIEAPVDGPVSFTGVFDGNYTDTSYAVLLKDTESTVSGLTFRGESARVHADGGAPVLEDLLFEGVGMIPRGWYVPQAVIVTGRTRATIRGNTLSDGGGIQVYDRSNPLVIRNVLSGGPHIVGGFGDETIIRGNSISRTLTNAVNITGPTTAVIEGNLISDVPTGINVGGRGLPGDEARGFDPLIRGNTITAVEGVAIDVAAAALPTIEANVLTDASIAIRIARSDPRVADNELRDNGGGILIAAGSPTLEGNTITGGTTGISLRASEATPTLSGNTVCDNETNVALSGGAQTPDTVGNDICEDDVSG